MPIPEEWSEEILPDMVQPLVGSLTAEQVVEEAKRCLNCAGDVQIVEVRQGFASPKPLIMKKTKRSSKFMWFPLLLPATGSIPLTQKKLTLGMGFHPNVFSKVLKDRDSALPLEPTKGEIIIQGKKPKEVILSTGVG